MNRLIWIAPMVLFSLAGIGLWLYFIHPAPSNPFHDELVPELVVFCIEGFILLGLLGLIQRSREHLRRHQLWLSLRGSFRDLLSLLDIAFLEPEGEPSPSRELETDPKVIDRLIEQLGAKHPDLDSLVAIKRESEETLSLTRDLVAVAAQLSAIHMNWWIAIVDSVRRLSEATDRRDMEKGIHEMLINIREFDRLQL
jgi:hypothetical protein